MPTMTNTETNRDTPPLVARLQRIESEIDDLERTIVLLRTKLGPIAVWRDDEPIVASVSDGERAPEVCDALDRFRNRIAQLALLVMQTGEDIAL